MQARASTAARAEHGGGSVIRRMLVALMLACTTVVLVGTPGVSADTAVSASSSQPTLRQGDRGEAVARMQQRLVNLRYLVGSVDGIFGGQTAQAVMAFQKVNRLEADSIVGRNTWAALADPVRPVAKSRSGLVIEINRSRQVMLQVRDGKVAKIINTSTGRRGMATPLGRFRVFRHIDGWRHAPAGSLYRPKYFNEGIAVHGAHEVPNYPASHGCARVSLQAMDWLFDRTPIGTRVWVY